MKKKKIILLSAGGVAVATAIFAGVYIARNANKDPVKVYSYSELGQGYWGDSLSMSGMVTTDVSQNIYVESERTVGQVAVAEGQQVTEGDVLFTYDTELDALNLETEQLNRQSMELKKQGYEKAIKDIQNGKTTSVSWNSNQNYTLTFLSAEDSSTEESTPTPEDPTPTPEDPTPTPEDPTPEEPTPSPTPEAPREEAYDYLDFMSKPFAGSGSEEEPYRFLVTEDVVVTGAFWNKVAGFLNPAGQGERKNPVWFYLEVHQKDIINGGIMRRTISVDGSTLEPRAMEETSKAEWIPTEAVSELTVESVPYSGAGTQGNPYRFVVGSETKMSGEFLESMKAYYFCLELRENNTSAGNVIASFYKDGSTLGEINLEQQYQIDFEKGIITPVSENPEDPDEPINPDDPYFDGYDDYGDYGDYGDDYGFDGFTSGEVPTQGMTAEEKKAAIEKKQREIKSLELDMKQSDLKIQKLQKKIESATVTSTLNGVVEKLKDPADVTSGEVFISISNSGGLYVRGTISELMLDQVSVGQELTGYTYESGVSFVANIKEISEYPDTSQESYNGIVGSNYPFMAKISEDSTGMKSQEYAELQMTVQEDSSGMYIPTAFVRKENGGSYIFKSEDGILKKQSVTTGKTVWGSLIEIKDGISSEDFIAFPYGKNVKEGAKTQEAGIEELYQ